MYSTGLTGVSVIAVQHWASLLLLCKAWDRLAKMGARLSKRASLLIKMIFHFPQYPCLRGRSCGPCLGSKWRTVPGGCVPLHRIWKKSDRQRE